MGAGHKGNELWSCLGDRSQLFRHSNASEIQLLSGPRELGEASSVSPVLLGDAV